MTNIDIKALAKEISKAYNKKDVIKGCEFLIGECDPEIEDCYIIEDGIEDGFLGYDEWSLDIRITPEVKYYVTGGYVGCDWSDCDHIVDKIKGIDYIAACYVGFCDKDGNEHMLDENQLGDLQNELGVIYKI